MKTTPELFVIAGPNGAGETTFAKEFLPRFAKCWEFVNADLIARAEGGEIIVIDTPLFLKIKGELQ